MSLGLNDTQRHCGHVIDGIVMRKDADEVLVDIGFKSEGIIPNNELQSLTATELANLGVGDEVLVSVLQPEDKEGHVVLSLDRARQERSWRNLQKQFENNEIIEWVGAAADITVRHGADDAEGASGQRLHETSYGEGHPRT